MAYLFQNFIFAQLIVETISFPSGKQQHNGNFVLLQIFQSKTAQLGIVDCSPAVLWLVRSRLGRSKCLSHGSVLEEIDGIPK